ncbi:MAG: type I glyceraldehyde-3-phosphate dehydrogenase [Desulfovibrionales bacterium]
MAIRIGMNGFGRIGRYLTRLLMDEEGDLQLAVVNARADNHTYAHMFKYDSVFGTYQGEVSHNDEGMVINGKQVKVTRWSKPEETRWGDLGCDIVIEATGKFKDRKAAEQHMAGGAKKVILSTTGKDTDVEIVYNVNTDWYKPAEHDFISVASCTTNALAPAAKILHDNFTIRHGLMTTIHSYTMTQRILDGSHKDLRRGRAAAMSQIPTTTGAAKAVTKVIPDLKGKFDGMAVRVPTPDGSLIDLVCVVEKATTVEAVNDVFKKAANETMGYSDEPLVSVDYIGDSHGGVFDALSTMVIDDHLIKTLIWYDNEAGFTHQLLRVVKLVARSM